MIHRSDETVRSNGAEATLSPTISAKAAHGAEFSSGPVAGFMAFLFCAGTVIGLEVAEHVLYARQHVGDKRA